MGAPLLSLSIDRMGTFAIPRAHLEHDVEGTVLAVDLAMVVNTPVKHFIGINDNLFDALSSFFKCGDARPDLLKKFDIGGRIIPAANLVEPGIIFRINPYDSNDVFVHGDVISLSVVAAPTTVAEAGGAASAPGGGLPA